MSDLPTGTVTFLFTDLEGSTRLWEQHPEEMKAALARHDEILRDTVESNGGHIVKTTGDGVHAVFAAAVEAASAALQAQRSLTAERWNLPEGVRVRMGIHTGEAELRDGDYYGSATNRAARLMSAAHGGQVLISLATEELVRDALPDDSELRDLGEHRLRDLARPERVFELHIPGGPEFAPLRSLDAYPSNLPMQLTSFVGRDTELSALAKEIGEARLVTITGVGGVGKTRLATQLAAEVLPRFRDGVWLSELAPAPDSEAMAQVVASSLGVNRRAGFTLEDSVVDFLRRRNVLLVLDNCEHLLSAAGTFAESVLRSCPDVRILATSREGLAVVGEQVWPLRSLEVPPSNSGGALLEMAAVRLFVERARAARPGFDLDARNSNAVAEICRRLDGIPLAIELAAARVESMSAPEIAALLDERFRLLTGGRRTAIERHQTLRGAVDWSYSLLTDTERLVFDRLGVFAGTFDASSGAAVVSGEDVEPWDVRDALAGLVAKSLLVPEETQDGTTRYQLLETLRQYALEQLDSRGETDRWRQRHAQHFASLAEQAGRALVGPDELQWRRLVGYEIDNLRLAVLWSLDAEAATDVLFAMRIIAALAYESTMRRSAGIANWAERALSRIEDIESPALRMSIYGSAAIAVQQNGDVDRIDGLVAEALKHGIVADCVSPNMALVAEGLARTYAGDPRGALETARSYAQQLADLGGHPFDRSNMLGTATVWAILSGDLEAARELSQEALRLAREIRCPSAIAMATHGVAWAIEDADPDEALALHEESIALTRSGASDVMLTNALCRVAQLRQRAGLTHAALSALREAIVHSADDDRPGAVGALFRTGLTLADLEVDVAAATLDGSIRGPLAAIHVSSTEDHEHDDKMAAVRARLGSEADEAAHERGARFTYDETITYALSELDRLLTELGDA